MKNRQFDKTRLILNQLFLKQARRQTLPRADGRCPVPHRSGEVRHREGGPHAFYIRSSLPEILDTAVGLGSQKNPRYKGICARRRSQKAYLLCTYIEPSPAAGAGDWPQRSASAGVNGC